MYEDIEKGILEYLSNNVELLKENKNVLVDAIENIIETEVKMILNESRGE